MKPNFSRSVLISVMVLVIFVFSAISTVAVYADDTTPPPTETPTDVIPPVEESAPAAADPAPVAEEPVAELLTQVPEGTDVVVVNKDGETVPLATQEAADAIELGDPVWCPAGVAPKTDGTGGCTTSYGNLKALMDALMAGNAGVVPGKAGVIWIEASNPTPDGSAGPILLNGNDLDLGAMKTFSLTLQGGWSGVNGSSSVSLASPSTFTQSLSIINWLGDITLKNLTFTGVTVGSASNNAALNIQTAKKITLTNVHVNGNTGAGTVNGAWLDNADADLLVLGDVSITSSTFNDNKNVGLTVNSEGAITLANVLVNGNDAGGAYLYNTYAASAKAVTITTGTNEFSGNKGIGTGDGLYIESKGVITLKDITANDNGGRGIYLDNQFGSAVVGVTFIGTTIASDNHGPGFLVGDGIRVSSDGAISAGNLITNSNGGWGTVLNNENATTPQPVKLTGNNEFKFNGNGGLYIASEGAVTTNNVVASNNGSEAGVRMIVGSDFPGSVTMTGTNIMIDNGYTGLEILTGGAIVLNNVTAYGNGLTINNGFGVYLNNAGAVTPMAVTINGTNTFNNNYSGGLEIHSMGTVTLSRVTANNNTHGGGAWIKNDYGDPLKPQNVTLTTANTFIGNYGTGLHINTYGAITIANLTANENGDGAGAGKGAELNNTGALPKAVTLTGINKFNDNFWGGLYIYSKGAITLNSVTADKNTQGNGVLLDNTASTPSAPQNITLTGTNQFNGNNLSGLDVNTYGIVLLSKVTASENLGYGALIHNEGTSLPKAVTVTGYGSFSDNGPGGLYIYTKGAITLNNVTANNNTAGHGVRLDSRAGTGLVPDVPLTEPLNVQNVTINGTNTFNGNFDSGLWVFAWGAILTNNLTVNDNGGYGAMLDNLFDFTVMTFKPVTLNGVNVFNANQNDSASREWNQNVIYVSGLNIISTGKITVNKLDASNNLGSGATINSWGSSASSGITMTGWVYADNNAVIGLNASANGGYINVANLNINKGGATWGALLNVCDVPIPLIASCSGNITVSGVSQIFDSQTIGLRIWTSGGSVTLSNLTVSGNNGPGVTIDTTRGGTISTGPQNVTITGFNTFWENGFRGLDIETFGAVTISNLDVYNNGNTGVYVNVLAAKNVTLTGSNFFESNGTDGLYVSTLGAISISNIHSKDNGGNGAYLKNQWGVGSLGGITLTGLNSFENNNGSGVVALSNGAISMSNLTAELNKGNGALLENQSVTGLTAVAVTLTGVNTFMSNGNGGTDSGLVINAGGQITLSNVTASKNQAAGADLDNLTNTAALLVKPGVKLTGVNIFNLNLATGLDILSAGVVDLANITADDNGADGVYAITDGTFTLVCGSMNENTGSGWDLTAGGLITLKGVIGFGNSAGNFTSSIPVVSRACPPAPVVVLPVDNSDDEPHGSTRTPVCYRGRDGVCV